MDVYLVSSLSALCHTPFFSPSISIFNVFDKWFVSFSPNKHIFLWSKPQRSNLNTHLVCDKATSGWKKLKMNFSSADRIFFSSQNWLLWQIRNWWKSISSTTEFIRDFRVVCWWHTTFSAICHLSYAYIELITHHIYIFNVIGYSERERERVEWIHDKYLQIENEKIKNHWCC